MIFALTLPDKQSSSTAKSMKSKEKHCYCVWRWVHLFQFYIFLLEKYSSSQSTNKKCRILAWPLPDKQYSSTAKSMTSREKNCYCLWHLVHLFHSYIFLLDKHPFYEELIKNEGSWPDPYQTCSLAQQPSQWRWKKNTAFVSGTGFTCSSPIYSSVKTSSLRGTEKNAGS
jgi:hypothetical protein